MNLFNLKKGQICIIDKILILGDMRRRLLDLGLISGTKVKCVEVSPFGDPKAFSIRGAVIALRKSECKQILIKEPHYEQ
ncbi:MAG: ferrous iron transport protein A [Ruminococcaceae bacterium]|nr:ferrous iron transport protein A [Oscillospiraceae bacterium]